MPVNFHDESNRLAYTGRQAHKSWADTIRSFIVPQGIRVADIGCGGGIYSRAWVDLCAASVIGVDSSNVMVEAAREQSCGVANLSFTVGDAVATGLEAYSVDLVFERALIHHLNDLRSSMAEAYRILGPAGRIIIQDRTPDDVALPGSFEHIRGYFFERFPELLSIEQSRRWPGKSVQSAMTQAGFRNIREESFWETRRVYQDFSEVANDLRNRTGRSILHELSDLELEDLIGFIGSKGSKDEPIVEKDRWTLWVGER
jgi:ubiquinone/menaquinone biosynthesis C-methylase UbiE